MEPARKTLHSSAHNHHYDHYPEAGKERTKGKKRMKTKQGSAKFLNWEILRCQERTKEAGQGQHTQRRAKNNTKTKAAKVLRPSSPWTFIGTVSAKSACPTSWKMVLSSYAARKRCQNVLRVALHFSSSLWGIMRCSFPALPGQQKTKVLSQTGHPH